MDQGTRLLCDQIESGGIIMSEKSEKKDREKIINHIHSIFKAFLGKDREAIKNAHSNDWVGFMGPSQKIERGIDDYMVHADLSLSSYKGVDYEIIDTEIQLYGDLGIVYYVARYDYEDANGERHSIPLRSVDIYRREADGWIQAGSHITPIPSHAGWDEEND